MLFMITQKLCITVTGNPKLDSTAQHSKMSTGNDEDKHKLAVSFKFLCLLDVAFENTFKILKAVIAAVPFFLVYLYNNVEFC